jgi:23S rRNA-/tRNA-specific pseudouridylate synthase
MQLAAWLADARARTGWDAAVFERALFHGGLHLEGRPHGAGELPPEVGAGVRVDAYAFAWEPEPVPFAAGRILLERADWMAVDKPAWLPTQATRASRRLSLEALLRALTGCDSLVAVHRLDRETSGVAVLAKNAAAAARLGRVFAAGAVRKRYLALVAPAPARAAWEVSGFLGRVLDPRRYRFALRGDPEAGFRWSHTRFRRLASAGGVALVAAEPVTGRTHQLRAHLAAAGTPIAGDVVYGGAPAGRLQLHAAALAFELDGEAISLAAPLASDLEPAFGSLQRRGAGATVRPPRYGSRPRAR